MSIDMGRLAHEEGKALLQRLANHGKAGALGGGSRWNTMDAIWSDPVGKGVIYVGNQTAAQSLPLLREHGVTHVLNCTHGDYKIPDFHAGTLKYMTLPISDFSSLVKNTDASMHEFMDPVWAFIDSATRSGNSVLVHCLAGAHRAGTTGVACLIHYERMSVPTAVATAKSLRSAIDPIGRFPDFLRRLHKAEESRWLASSQK